MTLASQTDWVSGATGMRLGLRISTALPDSRLGLDVVLYSRLTSRDAFVETLGGTEPQSEYPLDTPATIPLAAIRHGRLFEVHLNVTPSALAAARNRAAPTLALDCNLGSCAGIYPLELVLLDRLEGVALASLTTYLIYTPRQRGSLPLEVSLVLPLGARLALSPQGSPILALGQLRDLAEVIGVLLDHLGAPLSLELHGQLLEALGRLREPAASALLEELVSLARSPESQRGDELLRAPFGAPNLNALAAAGLSAQLNRQLAATAAAIASTLHRSTARAPYVSANTVDRAGLRLLEKAGITSVVLPPTSLATPATPVSTPTSPLLVADPGHLVPARPPAPGTVPTGTTEAILSDPGLADAFDAPSTDPVLSAHQFLAEVATVYFDDPFSSQPRGVVIAPSTLGSSSQFLADVLAGLSSSPILKPETLAGFLASVPVGANGAPVAATLEPHNLERASMLDASAVRAATRALATLRAVVPTDHLLAARLSQSILLGESAGLSQARRSTYEDAPIQALASIGRHLSLSGVRATTLTSRTGRIPVTVQSTLSVPVHVLLRLRSSELTFAKGRSELTIPLDLTGKAIQSDIKVASRTSGSSRLDISLLSPRNGYVLVDKSVAVHSTAISGVAVALSLGALLVLVIWWVRSSRSRKANAANTTQARPT
jgi:hypothetical protein